MSRTGKDREETTMDALDELRADLEREMNEIRNTIKERGPEAAEESVKRLRAELDRRITEIREGLDETAEEGRKIIRDHPLTAVGGALAIGLILGLLLARGRGRD